jgi:hypothetical protein
MSPSVLVSVDKRIKRVVILARIQIEQIVLEMPSERAAKVIVRNRARVALPRIFALRFGA